ncbi:Lhr-like helicase [Pseudomonas syringae pv. actinidiae]|uniref:Lhr-like helicase n=1 Tax=Pseudomonas syringae pv. actinidiae TaxID=103796 RepID=A0AAN4QBR9_PSESF|nr:Lhr-like helicase [Pseudomonas syringae pv. actinidiae]
MHLYVVLTVRTKQQFCVRFRVRYVTCVLAPSKSLCTTRRWCRSSARKSFVCRTPPPSRAETAPDWSTGGLHPDS